MKTTAREIEALVKKAERMNAKTETLIMSLIHVNKQINKTIDEYKKKLIIFES